MRVPHAHICMYSVHAYIVWIIPVKTTRVQSHCQSLLCPLCLIDAYRPWLRKPKILCPTSFRISPSFRCCIWQMFSSFTYCTGVVSFSCAGKFFHCIFHVYPLFKCYFSFSYCFTESKESRACIHLLVSEFQSLSFIQLFHFPPYFVYSLRISLCPLSYIALYIYLLIFI